MPEHFSLPVVGLLRKAGWYEGRDATGILLLPTEFSLFSQAQVVLAEFGGLHIGQMGAGIDCARSDVRLDPSLAAHLSAALKRYEQSLNTKLYPLGEAHGGHMYYIIDEQGRTYLYQYLLRNELVPQASTFVRGLEMLLLGKKASREEIDMAWGANMMTTK